ncbi:hypothetical protein Nepgr_005606 [Nepenthes gracilis]|uniref:Uncharacterized protein n=1 Tax=Nepenthes gracilis TaxID=150966 RepID=A0AAD3S3Y3_NEPGR|nr:hypothetical protein Nepgr_005606 [Nepenthes gracilis]
MISEESRHRCIDVAGIADDECSVWPRHSLRALQKQQMYATGNMSVLVRSRALTPFDGEGEEEEEAKKRRGEDRGRDWQNIKLVVVHS